jgi:hypothetical protein
MSQYISFGETLFATWLAYWLFRLHFVGPQLEGPLHIGVMRSEFIFSHVMPWLTLLLYIWGSRLQISAQGLAILTDSGCPQSLR